MKPMSQMPVLRQIVDALHRIEFSDLAIVSGSLIAVAAVFGALEYDLSRALSLAVIVQQQRAPYVSSLLATGVGQGVGINDGTGSYFDLVDAHAWVYSLMIQYGF